VNGNTTKILNHDIRSKLGICKLPYKTQMDKTDCSMWKEWNITDCQNKYWAINNKKKGHGMTYEMERQLS
jgi:hypothetical protein